MTGSPQPDPAAGIRRLASASIVATLLLIAMGGAVRATDSGLACPDWPACYGQWIPPADLHMWLEHSHRLWAGVVGMMIAALLIWTWRHRHRDRWPLRLTTIAAVLVIIQAGLGAAVVLLHLRAGLVTSHLAMSFIIVACLVVIAVRSRAPAAPGLSNSTGTDTAALHRSGTWALVVAGLVLAQSALGGQATGRGAAHVFNAFPIWLTADAWTGHMREVLHVTHRAGGYLVAAAVIALAVRLRRQHRRPPTVWIARLATVAVALVALQVALGITNVLTEAHVASAIAHLAVASWLWTALVLAGALALSPTSSNDDPSGTAGHTREEVLV